MSFHCIRSASFAGSFSLLIICWSSPSARAAIGTSYMVSTSIAVITAPLSRLQWSAIFSLPQKLSACPFCKGVYQAGYLCTELPYTVLCGLCLKLSGCLYIRNERKVNIENVFFLRHSASALLPQGTEGSRYRRLCRLSQR